VALRELGFEREQIRMLVARTVTHVGVNDLSEQQWLDIALRHAKAAGELPSGDDKQLVLVEGGRPRPTR